MKKPAFAGCDYEIADSPFGIGVTRSTRTLSCANSSDGRDEVMWG